MEDADSDVTGDMPLGEVVTVPLVLVGRELIVLESTVSFCDDFCREGLALYAVDFDELNELVEDSVGKVLRSWQR